MSSKKFAWLATACMLSVSLAACGGDDSGSAFLVRGNKVVNGLVKSYAVCVETGNYIDLNSAAGLAMKNNLLQYFGLLTPLQMKSDSSKSCRELDPAVDQVLSMSDYNNIVVPAVSK